MDSAAKAAFITAQAACCHAEIMAMVEQNISDRQAGRPLTYHPHAFRQVPVNYGLGYNDMVRYLSE